MINRYVALLGIALLLLSGAVSAGTLTLCVGNTPTAMDGYKFQLVNILPAKSGTYATLNILGVVSAASVPVGIGVTERYTDTSTGNTLKVKLDYTTNDKCLYLDVGVDKPVASSCKDTDSNDLNTKGSVSAYDAETGKTSELTDYCVDSKTVYEYDCDGVRVWGYSKSCGDGYTCSEGACVKEKVSCTDSDGKDLYTKGTATGLNSDKTMVISSSDYCTETAGGAQTSTGAYVAEEMCLDDGRVAAYYYACPSGYSCNAGACVKKPEAKSCTKTDSGIYEKGSVTGWNYYNTTQVTVFDSCSLDGTGSSTSSGPYVIESKCDGSTVYSTHIPCPSGYSCNAGACVKQSIKNDVCYDGDSGYSYYTPSKTYIVGKESEAVADYCADASTVVEYACTKGAAGDMITSTKYQCPGGYECSGGACVKKAEAKDEKTCRDSDNGFDIYKKGYRTVNNSIIATDYCAQSGKLVETWCHGNDAYTKEIDCPTGYQCSDGACIAQPTSTTQANETATGSNLPLTVYVLDANTEHVKNAYVTMYKLSDNSAVHSFYTDKDGQALFYSWHFTAGEPVYFLATTKDGKKYESALGTGLTVEYKDGKYCVYKSGVSECGERYSLGLFEVSTITNGSEKPPVPPTENATASYYTIALQPGWNLISVPFEVGKLTSTDCDVTTVYTLNPEGRSYTKDNLNGKSWFGFEGYWMKSAKTCKLQFEVSADNGFYTSSKLDEAAGRFATSLKLSKGWNMVGAPSEGITFSQIAGTCALSSGPWGFNTATNSWEKAATLESGKGYFVKVTEDCVLGSAMPPLPPS